MPHANVAKSRRGRAKALRRAMTYAERKLWYAIRAHRFLGLGFRRQEPLGRYIIDFVSHDANLIVEVDGGHHFSGRQAGRDSVRDRWLVSQGFRVVRVSNADIMTNLSGVIEFLESLLLEATPLPTLPHQGGGGEAVPYGEEPGGDASRTPRL